jgi:hypothetical protein
MAEYSIDKLEAARRQLDMAIKLFFDNEDGFAVYTLAYAAFKILFDIYPVHKNDDFAKRIDDVITQIGWKRFNNTANFLKHGDRDPHDLLPDQDAESAQGLIGLAAVMYRRLAGDFTPLMRGFDLWTEALNPEAFRIPPDENPDREAIDKRAREFIKSSPAADRLIMGKLMVEALTKVWEDRDSPDLVVKVRAAFESVENMPKSPATLSEAADD